MSESNTSLSFVHACLRGEALLEDIDDWVDTWHDSQGVVSGMRLSLDEYLGFTSQDGALWAERPESLRFIIAAHRSKRPVFELMQSRDQYAVAARTLASDDAAAVVKWLESTGRFASPV